ncbi:hypothetical protein KL951_003365 [Ogataea haglerorum]|nr:hypothetical protein KL951_003365 [Ogataea haglerorum]
MVVCGSDGAATQQAYDGPQKQDWQVQCSGRSRFPALRQLLPFWAAGGSLENLGLHPVEHAPVVDELRVDLVPGLSDTSCRRKYRTQHVVRSSSNEDPDGQRKNIEMNCPQRDVCVTARVQEPGKDRSPADEVRDVVAPVDPVRVVVDAVLFSAVQVSELVAALSHEKVVADHNPQDPRKEDLVRAEVRRERERGLGQVPRSDGEGKNHDNDGPASDVDVLWTQSCRVVAAGNDVGKQLGHGLCDGEP